MNKLFALSFLLAATLPLLAQNAPPPPTPPLVAQPTVGTSWHITFHFDTLPGTKPVTASRLPDTATYHCAKNVTVVVLNWSDGTRTTGYIFGNTLLERNGDAGPIASLQVQDGDLGFPVFTKGYPGVKWTALSNYKGQQPAGSGPAYYFVSSARASEEEGDLNIKIEAWIRVSDKVPARVKLGDTIYDFSSIESSSDEIDLPPDVAALAKQVTKEANALDILQRAEQHHP